MLTHWAAPSILDDIELEKIGRDLMATIVSLTLVLINSELELPGRRHRAFPSCSVSLFRKWNAPFHYRLHTAAGVGGNLPRGVRGKSSPGRPRLEKWGQIHPLRAIEADWQIGSSASSGVFPRFIQIGAPFLGAPSEARRGYA